MTPDAFLRVFSSFEPRFRGGYGRFVSIPKLDVDGSSPFARSSF
jgi:hypothetical protein